MGSPVELTKVSLLGGISITLPKSNLEYLDKILGRIRWEIKKINEINSPDDFNKRGNQISEIVMREFESMVRERVNISKDTNEGQNLLSSLFSYGLSYFLTLRSLISITLKRHSLYLRNYFRACFIIEAETAIELSEGAYPHIEELRRNMIKLKPIYSRNKNEITRIIQQIVIWMNEPSRN